MFGAPSVVLLFFFKDPPTTEIYTLSLHDALPIWRCRGGVHDGQGPHEAASLLREGRHWHARSEEHTSELQSRGHLVCRLLLEKKKKKIKSNIITQSRNP